MDVVGVGLVKVYKALIRLAGWGALCPPSDVYVRSFLSLCILSYNSATQKLLSDQAWSLVPSPKAKFFGDHESNIVHHKLS